MNKIDLFDEKDFCKQMDEIVAPYLEKRKIITSVESCKGGQIHCATFTPEGESLATIVIFHGFCEFTEKYNEFVYYALQQGYSVCLFDHRGHGFSPRNDLIEGNYSIVDIDSYDTYVIDAKSVVEKVAKPLAKETPLFLFAHSMGGAIATLYLSKYKDDFTCAILNSPMLQVNLTLIPFFISKPLVALVILFIGKQTLAPTHSNFPVNFVLHEKNHAGTSAERFYYAFNKRKTDKRLQTWGASMQWVGKTVNALQYCNKKKNLQKIITPILLFQAENDETVYPGGQNKFVKYVKTSKKIIVKNSDHEMFIGKTDLALPWYENIYTFYDEFLNKKGN